jgi:NAD+ diphosphatase
VPVTDPTRPAPDDFCVPVLGDQVLLADNGARVALVSELPPGSALQHAGAWRGRPLWTAELTEPVDGFAAYDWAWCLARLEPARLEPAARALRMAGFRRSRRFCGACATEMADAPGLPARRCPACGQLEWASPTVAALVAVWRPAAEDGRREALLVRHTYQHHDTWFLVGGLVDPAETLEQTARREVAEEVGLDVGELTYVGSEHWGLNGPNLLLTVFTAELLDPAAEPRVDGREIAEARFFPVDALPENRIPDNTIAGRVLRDL